ncbi:glycosyltransferase family 4 protein [Halomonas sp. KM-1]|uniref:glycosyltransferase family 4 protein n=1 Tax=Halomonas sp. KM-1 TaxID=590061 RepID=UPI00028A344D|nr:glycosyltransferase family 4 protein [Halomonas sp. KM-1]
MFKEKPVVLAFNKFYLPGYKAGGPIRSLVNMVDHLGDKFDFYILTLDHDAGDRNSYQSIQHGKWHHVGKSKVMYLSPEDVSINKLVKIISYLNPAAIYLNSYFDSSFTLRVLLSRRLNRFNSIPIILAPRGEFSAGALGIKSFKKRAYIRMSSVLGLYRNLIWQASSSLEKEDILRSLKFVRYDQVKVAVNLTPIAPFSNFEPKAREVNSPLKVCFLSRITPKKNLDFALDVLRQVSSKVTFTIYGPKESTLYWVRCESLIEDLPDNITVVYAGEVLPNNVNANLAQHDLFFFPTRGENYGHVIHEALLSGLPVLISDQTPWDDLEAYGIGWSYSLQYSSFFSKKIDDFANMLSEETLNMRKRAMAFAINKSSDSQAVRDNIDLFEHAVSLMRPS